MSIIGAVAPHLRDRIDAPAITDGGTAILTWREIALFLPSIAADLATQFGDGRPVAIRTDYGVARCLLDLAMIEANISTAAIPAFFTPEQVSAALDAAGCEAFVTGVRLDLANKPRLRLTVERTLRRAVPLPEGTAVISFTSGSTGDPKGVCLSATHLGEVARATVYSVGTEHAGRHLPLLPPGILLESIAGFHATIIAGGCYVALSQAEVGLGNPFRPNFRTMAAAIASHTITSLILVPEYLLGLVAVMEATGLRLPDLTLVAVGGARVDLTLLDRAAALGLPVRQGYGLTECGSVVALERGAESVRGSVGKSIGPNRVTLAPDGEILIHGPMFLGTIGAPRTTGPLRTGDIGRIDAEGLLWIEGRKSSLIVTSFGRNISPEWIEGALTARPEILQAMVRGDSHAQLDALIVPATRDADIGAAVAAVNAALPAYARVARWEAVPPFTPAAGLLTGNGRLKRVAIAARYPEGSDAMPFFDRLAAETREAQARFAMVPQLQAGLSGGISRNDYLAYLAQAYHHVRHTVPLMQEARSRLASRPVLVDALNAYIVEETGHEAWILDDVEAAGGDPAAVAASAPAPATAAMVDHAYRTVRGGNPAALFGMVYVLEGTSIAMASLGAEAVQATLGLPPEAFRYLTSHGALDHEHMRFFEGLMNRIDDPVDQAAIIAMANDIFGLFGAMFAAFDLEGIHVAA